MKSFEYKDCTIQEIYMLYKTNYIKEIVFDADNKKVKIKENEYSELMQALEHVSKSVKLAQDAVLRLANTMSGIFNEIFDNARKSLNKKMKKKKFIKLLQAEGIQRNTIKEIVKGNEEPYTYTRYYITLQNFIK